MELKALPLNLQRAGNFVNSHVLDPIARKQRVYFISRLDSRCKPKRLAEILPQLLQVLCVQEISPNPRGLVSSCGAQTPHYCGFSCCRAPALDLMGFRSCSSGA